MKILGVDYGDRRIGLSISDELSIIVHGLPLLEISYMEEGVEQVASVATEKNVDEIVVGLPKNMNNTIGERAKIVLDFVEKLKTCVNIPVVTWDERLTTIQAGQMLSDVKMTHSQKKRHLNTVSAQIILQSYLDAKKRTNKI